MLAEPVGVVVIFHGTLVSGHHILRRHRGSIGKGCPGVQIDGPVFQIGGHLIAAAQNGGGIFLAVHGKQALIHQRHQHPVGVVAAQQRVHLQIGVVGQGQLLGVLFLRHDVLRILAFHQYGIAGGHIGGVINLPAAARQRQGQRHNQQPCCSFFHRQTSLHTINAPWEPRSPLVYRWDQNRWWAQ